MPRAILRVFFLLFAALLATPSHAQFGKKNKGPTDKAPELSDSDKKKMAEIEQRPEVQDLIRSAWDEVRRKDLDYAFVVNSSVRFAGSSSLEQVTSFRQNYGELYNNPMLQRYLNNIGQKLVPKDSPNFYSFKLLLDPVPRAEALSTGSIYVSTGMISLLDNEAQLSYVLAHEIAHVEKNHHYNEIKNTIVQEKLNQEKEKDAARKSAIFTAAASLAGAGIGGLAGGGSGAVVGAFAGAGGGLLASHFLFRSKTTVTEWSEVNENEADESALPYMMSQSYDAREIPRLFARLQNLTTRDSRVGLGFLARPDRVKMRTSHMDKLLSGAAKSEIDAKLKAGGLIGSTPEFPLLMAALKRDNGIMALEYDLFAESRDNLEEAVSLRSNDARAQLYLGRVMATTARTGDDKQQAMNHFMKAIQYDEGRGAYPDPHLERALDMIAQNNPAEKDDIRKEIQIYVALYQRENKGALPTNMPILYDYIQLAGDTSWYVAPTSVISTKYVEPLHVSTDASAGTPSVQEVVMTSIGAAPSPVAKTVSDVKAPAPRVVKKVVSTPNKPVTH